MRTTLDCLPCFMRQALAGARRADPENETLHRAVLNAWAKSLGSLDLEQSPPAIAGRLYSLLAEFTGSDDIYFHEKKEANRYALDILPALRSKVKASRDPLATALEVSIIGNYMDCGIGKTFDWEGELRNVGKGLDTSAYHGFKTMIGHGVDVLILGDNAGEIALDKLLVEILSRKGCDVTYAVRGRPVLNDVTVDDAREVGMDDLCEVVASGVDTPGTVLDRCDPEFVKRMNSAGLILSKGQGNFESLHNEWPGVYFAFKVKCPVVEKITGYPEGHSMLLKTAEKHFDAELPVSAG